MKYVCMSDRSLLVCLTSGQRAKPDRCRTVTSKYLQSTFFKIPIPVFRKGWSTVDDDFRTTEKPQGHEKQVQSRRSGILQTAQLAPTFLDL